MSKLGAKKMSIPDTVVLAAELEAGRLPVELTNMAVKEVLMEHEKVIFGEASVLVSQLVIGLAVTGLSCGVGLDMPEAISTKARSSSPTPRRRGRSEVPLGGWAPLTELLSHARRPTSSAVHQPQPALCGSHS